MRFAEQVQAGVVVVNGGTHGSEPHMGFGGVKQSGTGWREAGRRGARRLLRLEVRQPDRRPGEDMTSLVAFVPARAVERVRERTSGRSPATR